MAITARKRKSLPRSAFVYPAKRKYPIDTKQRARSALRLGAKRNTYGSAATIRRKVYKRYPSLKPGAKHSSSRAKRGR